MTETMSSPERIMAALQLQEPDRLPVIPVLMTRAIKELKGATAVDAHRNPEIMAAAKLKSLGKYGGDAVICGTDLFVEVETLGATLDYLPTAQPSLIEHPIKRIEELEGLTFQPATGRAFNVAKEIAIVAEALSGAKIIGVVCGGPLTVANLLVGSTTFIHLMENDEPFTIELLRVATDAIKAYISILLEAGAMAVNMLDPFASSDVVSPAYFEKYAFPYQKEIMAHIGANGGAPLAHICTHTEPIWPLMAELGAIGLHGDFWPGMHKAKRAIGGKVALFGSVNPFTTLIDGTPEDVRRESLALATRVGYNGGFVLAAGCDTDWNTPDANIHAMVQTAMEVTYPLDIQKYAKELADGNSLPGEQEYAQKQKSKLIPVSEVTTAEEKILAGLRDAVIDYDGARCRMLAQEGLALGMAATELIFDGLSVGMRICGDMYERNERFVVDMLKCSKAMDKALDILVPLIKGEATNAQAVSTKIVLGLVRGNTQDIGKNLVSLMLTANGFEVIDLGKNVKPETFVETAEREGAHIIGMSVMTNSSITYVEQTLAVLEVRGLRHKVGLMFGGASANQKIGADLGIFYGADANEAVAYVKEWQHQHRNEE
ncbi:MAG: MtaA/CmuA family methyltransferase [Caldilineaceae bacterium]